MFARTATILSVLLALSILVVAVPWGDPPTTPTVTVTATVTAQPPSSTSTGQCNTGSAQCCNTVETSQQAGLLGIVLGPIEGLVGYGCSPLNVVGIDSGACNAHPVCCSGSAAGGLINIGCLPIVL